MELTGKDLLQAAVEAAVSKRATDTVVLDLKEISSVTDYFIVCSGSSNRNVRAISEAVEAALKEQGTRPHGIEGQKEGTWVLMDYVDVVIHIFLNEKREAYALEDLWKDAARVPVESAALEPDTI